MTTKPAITVVGATGHTGRFVVAELLARGFAPVLAGRGGARFDALRSEHPELRSHTASIDDPAALDAALEGAAAVINCAGPFASTAAPVIDAAIRARIPYLDVAAEIEANQDTFSHYATRAREAGIVVIPAMAFYGGLGDLLATAAMGDWSGADEITIAYGLSSWRPTPGTRTAGQVSKQRRDGRRVVFDDGRLEFRDGPAPSTEWTFPAPLGTQAVIGEFTMADTLTIARHLRTPQIRSYMTLAAVKDLIDADPSAPTPVDDSGRSAQTFVVDVVARAGDAERRAAASGRDIYAITAPLVVEAASRILAGRVRNVGVMSAGEAFDARDFLRALGADRLRVELS
jgi:saccharopine dehydrogenase-like NADP-dependent oxidoreductase